MDSQYAQIPESSRTRWGLSILSVCVCVADRQYNRRGIKPSSVCATKLALIAGSLKLPNSASSHQSLPLVFSFFCLRESNGASAALWPPHNAPYPGSSASRPRCLRRAETKREQKRTSGSTDRKQTHRRTDSRRDAVKQSARVWYKLYSHQDSRRPSVCLYVRPSVCPPVACFRKPSPARLPTGLSPVPASRDISRFDPG